MGNHLYFKLAMKNLKRNKGVYIPYFVASSVMVIVFFLVMMIINSRGIANLDYGKTLLALFQWCSVIMMVVIVPFMLYINSFIIKQRKKEFGLYGILGLEKRHVGRVILWESLILDLLILFIGILLGCVFGKLIFMMLIKVMGTGAAGTVFTLPLKAFLMTGGVFVGVFFLTTLYNLVQVQTANPISLLQGTKKGEKKVRFVIPLTVLGLAILGWAYYMALTVGASYSAVNVFFLAAMAVIAATYILFIVGSVFFLRILKGKKKFYYQPKNFITIGSMFHRMRQNAAGLATICILSTMVIVTVSISTAIYFGQEDMAKKNCPYDVMITSDAPQEEGNLAELINDTASQCDIQIDNALSYCRLDTQQILKRNVFTPIEEGMTITASIYDNGFFDVSIINAEDYNAAVNTPVSLGKDEVLLLTNDSIKKMDFIYVEDHLFKVKSILADTPFTKGENNTINKYIVLVTADTDAAKALYMEMNPTWKEEPVFTEAVYLSISGNDENSLAFSNALRDEGQNHGYITRLDSLAQTMVGAEGLFGGFLFLGIFFSIVFLCAAILIIYYKQLSEGYEDKERFQILRNVGMTEKEVKATINRQILLVFFLPLVFALVHVFVAIKIINDMLAIMYLNNTMLTLSCIIGTGIIFALVYIIVYRLTAKVYYKTVSTEVH